MVRLNGQGSKTRSNSNVSNLRSFSMKRPSYTYTYAGGENRLSINSINLKPNRNNGTKVHKKAKRSLVLALKASDLSKKKNNSRRFSVKNKKHRTKRGKRSKPGSLRTTPSTSKASQDTIESVNSTNLDDIKEGTIKDIISDSNKDNGINTSCTDTSEDENDGNSRGNIRDWTYQDVCDWLKRELLNDSTIKNETIDKIMLKFEMNYIAGHVLLVLDQELLESIGIETENIRQKILALTQPKLKQQHVPQISQEIHAINDDTNSNLNASSSLTTIANTITSTKTNQSGTAGKNVTTDKAKCNNNDKVEKNQKTLDSVN